MEIRQGDALEFLQTFKDNSVDCVITDPPYESLEKHRRIGTTTRLKREWFEIFPNVKLTELFFQIYRVLKRNTHFYLFCDQETTFIAKPLAEDFGFKFWKPIVWDKKNIGMGYHYRSRYEFILFFEKGKRKLNDLGVADIIERTRIFKKYPTEKPYQVSSVLVSQSTKEGELIIDPFCGSGSVGEAAIRLNREFIGNDLSEKAVKLSLSRLSRIKPGVE